VRVSVPTFHSVGALVEGSALLATVPAMVAREIISVRPNLRTLAPPLSLGSAPMELLWRSTVEDDEAIRFVRERVVRVAKTAQGAASPRRNQASAKAP
jgi:LysR family transcriptional activator of mexEF-oprN operon